MKRFRAFWIAVWKSHVNCNCQINVDSTKNVLKKGRCLLTTDFWNIETAFRHFNIECFTLLDIGKSKNKVRKKFMLSVGLCFEHFNLNWLAEVIAAQISHANQNLVPLHSIIYRWLHFWSIYWCVCFTFEWFEDHKEVSGFFKIKYNCRWAKNTYFCIVICIFLLCIYYYLTFWFRFAWIHYGLAHYLIWIWN